MINAIHSESRMGETVQPAKLVALIVQIWSYWLNWAIGKEASLVTYHISYINLRNWSPKLGLESWHWFLFPSVMDNFSLHSSYHNRIFNRPTQLRNTLERNFWFQGQERSRYDHSIVCWRNRTSSTRKLESKQVYLCRRIFGLLKIQKNWTQRMGT